VSSRHHKLHVSYTWHAYRPQEPLFATSPAFPESDNSLFAGETFGQVCIKGNGFVGDECPTTAHIYAVLNPFHCDLEIFRYMRLVWKNSVIFSLHGAEEQRAAQCHGGHNPDFHFPPSPSTIATNNRMLALLHPLMYDIIHYVPIPLVPLAIGALFGAASKKGKEDYQAVKGRKKKDGTTGRAYMRKRNPDSRH